MKILAFADMHNSITAYKTAEARVKKHNPDVICCAGDFTIFEQYMEEMIRKLDKLGKPVMLIHGNHEEESVTRKLCENSENLKFVHGKIIEYKGVQFLGWGGGGFQSRDKEFEKWAKKAKLSDAPAVFITHAPPYGTALDLLGDEHCGNKSFSEFIKNHPQIKLAVSGHFHENFETLDKQGSTVFSNPGPAGQIYEFEA